MLERADIEHDNHDLRRSFMTFVVVGGGFSGVETVGELMILSGILSRIFTIT